MKKPVALSTLLATVLGGIVLAGVAAAALAGWLVVRDLTRELLGQRAIQAIGRLEQGLREHLAQAEHDVTSLARLLEEGRVEPTDRTTLAPVLQVLLASHDELTGIGVTTVDGTVTGVLRRGDGTIEPILQPRGTEPDPMLARRLALARAATGVVWAEPVFGGRLGEAVLFALRPVRRDGEFLGVVAAGISVGRLSALVESLSGNGEARPFVLLGDRVLAHPLLRLVPTGSRREPLEPVDRFADPALRGLGSGERLASYPGTAGRAVTVVRVVRTDASSELVLAKEIEGFGARPWTVGLVVPEMVIHPVLMPLRLFALVAFAIGLVAVAAAVAIGRRLARPVVRVTAAVERVSSLELDALAPLPSSRIAELDGLARAFNAMLSTLKAFATYVPKSLVERLIKAGRPDAVPSRERDLAVMFTDIQGFTAIAESLPPVEVARLLNAHFALLARCVEEEGGTVDKYLGDGMLAFWGAPEKIKNRGLRACRTALAIRRAIEADNARKRARGEPVFKVRIGLHRGPLLVGNIGAPGRLDYTVVGDTVNVAQRLMELARERFDATREVAIVASEAIAGEAQGEFRFVELGTLAARGREQPIRTFELVGEPIPVAVDEVRPEARAAE
ncbi:MAG: hypothetical protein KatS3mg117_1614 [Geminicoccaceae bacterium]|nr:MAG: hypothetical protein KatS3mg117_1614 [Geminicoccaceae bacterium]